MKPSAKDILDRALEMPESDRAAIAERLLASLDAKPDPDVEEAWQQEIQRRLSELDRGEVQCVPWEEVRSRMGKK
jgi:putative addiction module component (TIGR02574 family)